STSYSSIWVGLDGYANATVEQIGTEQDWTKRGQRNYAWFEMYPSGAYLISGFPVNPGDSISAQVQYEGNGVFQLTINNTTHRAAQISPCNGSPGRDTSRQAFLFARQSFCATFVSYAADPTHTRPVAGNVRHRGRGIFAQAWRAARHAANGAQSESASGCKCP